MESVEIPWACQWLWHSIIERAGLPSWGLAAKCYPTENIRLDDQVVSSLYIYGTFEQNVESEGCSLQEGILFDLDGQCAPYSFGKYVFALLELLPI